MSLNKTLLVILASSLLLKLLVVYANFQSPNFHFLQENYDIYTQALKTGAINDSKFSVYETRMFPGYVLAILPFTYFFNDIIKIGIVLNLIFFSISFFLIWKIFRSVFINFLFSFFPPIWISQSTKASSEPLTVLLLLSGIFALTKKYYFLTGLILGIAFNVRIISVCLFLAILVAQLFERKFNEGIKLSFGFLITASLLIIYNFFIFGSSNLMIQFTNLDQNYQTVTIGFIQIFNDILRTIDWGQYKILFSGIFYLIINLGALIILFKLRNKSEIIKICFYWTLFSLIFIFSLSPFTIIENFARYALPIIPAVCLAIDLGVKTLEEKSGFLIKKPKLSPDKKRVKAH